MTKKLFTLLIASVFVLVLSLPILAQEGSQKGEPKETPTQENAENEHKGKAAKQARWEGMVTRSNKDQSTLTVRKVGSIERTVHYDASTQFTSQEHGSKKINNIDATEISQITAPQAAPSHKQMAATKSITAKNTVAACHSTE